MELKNNDLVIGSSGSIGDQLVYRQRGGKTIIAKRPRKKNTTGTPRQLEVRDIKILPPDFVKETYPLFKHY